MRTVTAIAAGVIELVSVAAFLITVVAGFALATGHLLGGPLPDDRTALAVACATRHVGIAALAAATVPGEHTLVLLLAYLVVAGVLSFGYLRWRKSGPQATAEVPSAP